MSSLFEYAPAPESRSIVDIAPSYGLFVDGEFVDGTGEPAQDGQPGHRGGAHRGRRRAATPTSTAPSRAARRAFTRVWGPMRPADRGKYLFRIARLLQERAREFAVLESLDNGKPISESRDVDIPLAAAHFFYHAGWADKLDHVGLGAAPRPLGVAGQVIPWNFPLLMLAWKVAPGAGDRQHRRPQAGRDHAADRAAVRRGLPAGRPAAGRGQHRDRRRRHRPRGGRARRRRQGRLHRLDRGRQGDRPRRRRHPQGADAGARRQGGQHRLRRRPDRPGRRGHRARHLLQPGPRLLRRAPGCWCRSRCTTRSSPRCSAGSARCGSATRWTRTPTSARSTPPSSWPASASWSDIGEAEGAHRWQPDVRAARPRLLVQADGLHRRLPRPPDRPRRGLRPGAVGADLPHAGRGGGQGQQHHLRAVGRHLDGEGLADPARSPNQLRAGVVWANTFNQFDPTSPFGGYKQSGYGREGGRHGLRAYLKECLA